MLYKTQEKDEGRIEFTGLISDPVQWKCLGARGKNKGKRRITIKRKGDYPNPRVFLVILVALYFSTQVAFSSSSVRQSNFKTSEVLEVEI